MWTASRSADGHDLRAVLAVLVADPVDEVQRDAPEAELAGHRVGVSGATARRSSRGWCAKRQTRLAGLDDKILAMYAGGMTVREIEAHLAELYGVRIGRDTISRVTDAVLADVQAWRTRPLDEIYAIVYLDCLTVKVREDRSVRNRACYLAIGVTLEGTREVLGIWWRDSEGAKFWLAVLNDLHQRGVRDVLICCVDGLEGFPEAIEAVFPQAWVQTCVVHQIRAGMRYVSYTRPQERRRRPAPDLHRRQRRRRVAGAGALRRAMGRQVPDDHRRPGASAGSTSSRSCRCPPSSERPSTPPTASRTSTARSARRSRRAAASPTSRPRPS